MKVQIEELLAACRLQRSETNDVREFIRLTLMIMGLEQALEAAR